MDAVKRPRTIDEQQANDKTNSPNFPGGFELERVLNDNAVSKTVTLLGRCRGETGQAIVTLARRHFPLEPDACRALVQSCGYQRTFDNDVYSKGTGALLQEHSLISVDIISPCTAQHIAKHSPQRTVVIAETPALYAAVTQPYIESLDPAAIQWVYNILDKTKEADRLLYEDADADTGFVLHPDLKWDQTQVEALYCIAIVKRRDVRSVRDLHSTHLPLLRNVLTAGSAAITKKFVVPAQELRVYLHYPPSYYHLHVHFVHARHDASFGMAVGKGHALQDVISNLEYGDDFYARATLACALGAATPLCARLQVAVAAGNDDGLAAEAARAEHNEGSHA